MALYRDLHAEYGRKKRQIKKRLAEFSRIARSGRKKLFSELCFCLLTPQSNARYCDAAIRRLNEKGLLNKGNARIIGRILRGRARFHNKKAEYIVSARTCFDPGLFLMPGIGNGTVLEMREALVGKIKGMGYKEASHFLRNIGLGAGIAILDRHILKNLKYYGAIKSIPASMTRKAYLDIEERARSFSKKVGIPLDELDLLFWSREAGGIFK